MSQLDLLRAAAAVARGAGHASAALLGQEAEVRAIVAVDAVNCVQLPLGGASGVVAGSRVVIGTPQQLRALEIEVGPACAPPPDALCVASDGRLAGWVS